MSGDLPCSDRRLTFAGYQELEKHAKFETFPNIIKYYAGHKLDGKGVVSSMERANIV